jgi:glycosyltransferase involved in cell wall biosynthesis
VRPPLLLDLSHTSHTRARTGIQRVARSIRTSLGAGALAVCFDPYERAWRPLEAWENDNLAATCPATGRGARWPLTARLRGRLRRRRPSCLVAAQGGVLVPEIFSPAAAAALPALWGASGGPRVAVFHDAIALQFPEFTPQGTVARFPAYLRELLQFDAVAAVSEASRDLLLEYWKWLGVAKTPEVRTLSPGIELPLEPPETAPVEPFPTVLCVGSIEARKNHSALLEASEALWSRGRQFRLRLIGLANAETGRPALERIARLRAAGRPLDYEGAESEQALEAAYRACAFTVYPSLAEGFGLPVAESLARGRPCLCRTAGALGEIARGGGCLGLGAAGAEEIAAAMGRLLEFPEELAALAAAARARRFRSWDEWANEFLGWFGTIRRTA